jgi:hypothetical protein
VAGDKDAAAAPEGFPDRGKIGGRHAALSGIDGSGPLRILFLVGRKRRDDLVEKVEDAGPTLYGLVQLEMEERRVLENDPAGEFVLEMLAVGLEFHDRVFLLPLGPDGTHENVGVSKIRGDVDGADGDEGGLELDVPAHEDPEFTLDQLTDSYGA